MSSRLPLPPRSYNSPEIQAIVDRWEIERPAWEAEWEAKQREHEEAEEARLAPLRAAARERRKRKREWAAGVAKIMAEVRRRETMRALAEFGL